jgi:cytochrome c-type biogenesis protein CcmF
MEYIGEHLLPGQIGHFCAVLSLVASLVASLAYFRSTKCTTESDKNSWKRIARVAFGLNVVTVLTIFFLLLYIISNHYFEYNYAWLHSSKSLDLKYLLSCIWEGQEGGFLLWSIWQGVLGLLLIFRGKDWEAPVMTVVSFAQFALATMLLGIYVFGVKIGLNPFALVRELNQDAPIFAMADYMKLPVMQDGQGLNQLLQNYWMVIHPPVLFLGFASTLIPFAFAVAAVWKRRYTEWTRPVLPWALFSAFALGLGIMLGAAWAYESLTFGGYWAWDPVENASLVPWLILVAGLHTNLIFNSTGYSLRTTTLFYILTYLFVIYSSFLTKSGVLGDSSVHAFTSAGLNSQMMIWMAAFVIPSLILFFSHYKRIPAIPKEENTYSREFWMFIGSLVLFLSGLYVIVSTSLPVVNKLFGTQLAVGEDVEFSYNRIQIWIAVLLALLTAITQFFRYKNTQPKHVWKRVLLPALISVAITVAVGVFSPITYLKYGAGFLGAIYLALFASVFAVAGNIGYIWKGLHGKLKAAGGSVAHIGFGLMLVGILISSSKKEVLSHNTTGLNLPFDPASKENPLENLTLIRTMKEIR